MYVFAWIAGKFFKSPGFALNNLHFILLQCMSISLDNKLRPIVDSAAPCLLCQGRNAPVRVCFCVVRLDRADMLRYRFPHDYKMANIAGHFWHSPP